MTKRDGNKEQRQQYLIEETNAWLVGEAPVSKIKTHIFSGPINVKRPNGMERNGS